MIEVEIKVVERHPKDAISFANLFDVTDFLLHTPVGCLLPPLVPHV